MNGVHDCGGMDGLGPIDTTEHDGAFHARWEAEVYAAWLATLGTGVYELDEFRFAVERMDADRYLAASYYERWLAAVETLCVEAGVVDPAALHERAAAAADDALPESSHPDPPTIEELSDGQADAYATRRTGDDRRFDEGDRVLVRNRHPTGHTRCPRYARGAVGEVIECRDTHVLPDANAHGEERAEPVYNVRFDAAELFGPEETTRERVHLDLWESYLTEP